MLILDGKALASRRQAGLKKKITELERSPRLSVVVVGSDIASRVYVAGKKRACESLGILCDVISLPEKTTREDLKKCIERLNLDPLIDGILVQLPLPLHLNPIEVSSWVAVRKDVDGLHPLNLGLLLQHNPRAMVPCTPQGILALLEEHQIDLAGKQVCVVGRSQIVGLPLMLLCNQKNATTFLCHSQTQNLKALTQLADIVVVSIGKKHFFNRSYFKKNAVVVDVGIHRDVSGKLYGDVNPEGLEGWIKASTPIPGGVGPMTVQMLLENIVNACVHGE